MLFESAVRVCPWLKHRVMIVHIRGDALSVLQARPRSSYWLAMTVEVFKHSQPRLLGVYRLLLGSAILSGGHRLSNSASPWSAK